MPRAKKDSSSSMRHCMTPVGDKLGFGDVVAAIRQAHDYCAGQAKLAVNMNLTLRNWVIGWYIREYEQKGLDRARYGEGLIDALADRLKEEGLERMDARELRRYRLFYMTYPMIRESPPPELAHLLPPDIRKLLTGESESAISVPVATRTSAIREPATPELGLSMEKVFSALSFTHLAELIAIDDPLRRAFYEIECIRGSWSVRELKRQIATLYFERSGLSQDKEKLAAMVKAGAEIEEPRLAIRDPYVFEFLGLRAQDAVAESDLEAALVENLRDFLLEMGHGFCLEAQQKSIVIGNTRGFVDLVFYHRILKCHVLIELKVDEFRHEHIGQLNTYVTWYQKNMMAEGDNPPVGLLLCTGKDHALVEYALAAISNRMFVSKYQLELPSKEELTRFIEEKRREVGRVDEDTTFTNM
jgi:predicted nuclease of restriction endonuclease-like (RecB) superfamily